MKLKLQRFHSTDDFTIGKLFINDVFESYTIEDEKREQKVMHETRIPAGTYEIKLRTFGGHHEKYKVRFKDIHVGMLWLQDVPKFKDILIHCGNSEQHTSGCILLVTSVNLVTGIGSQSGVAYTKVYPKIAGELLKGEKVFIEIIDEL